MDKKVILLDTNIIYLLAGITSNDYNLKAIKKDVDTFFVFSAMHLNWFV